MEVTLTKTDVDALAKRIVEYLWEDIPKEAIPEKPKKTEVVEPAKTAEPVKEEAAVKQEETAYTLEQVIKAVKDYTLKDKDGAKKLKPILQS